MGRFFDPPQPEADCPLDKAGGFRMIRRGKYFMFATITK
jgi:hypothetical protein